MAESPEIEALVRVRLFEALSESEARYKALVERIQDVVFQYDENWNIVFLNRAWKDVLGRLVEESLNKGFLDFVYAEDRNSMAEYIRRTGTNIFEHKEVRLCHQNGQPQWFELSIEPNAEGNGGVGLLHNIDHHKNIELELRKARDLAIEAAEAKLNFVSNMSHEMRTPLNGILGGLQLLTQTDVDEEQQEYVGFAVRTGEDLLKLVENVLDYASIEGGQIQLERREIELHSLVRQALTATMPSQCPLQTKYTIATDVPSVVLGDPSRINQILSNLLDNAFKFTEQGQVNIKVSNVMSSAGVVGDLVRFTIQDTGIGIPQNRQSQFFELFTQGDNSSTRKYGGTGLGLALVKRLVKFMGGELSVESEEGVGSQFIVTLPLPASSQLL